MREGELKIKTEYGYVVVNPMNKATGIFLSEVAEGEVAKALPQEVAKNLPMNMGDIAVQVKSLRVQDKNLLVTLTYTNNGKDSIFMTFGYPQEQKLYIIDDVGNEYTYVKSTGGMVRGSLSGTSSAMRHADAQFMKLPVGRQVDVLYTFASSSEETPKGSVFSVFLEHYLVPEGAEDVRDGQIQGVSFTDVRSQ